MLFSATYVVIAQNAAPSSAEEVYVSRDNRADHVYIANDTSSGLLTGQPWLKFTDNPRRRHVYVTNPERLPVELQHLAR
jgi:hypothetical protein